MSIVSSLESFSELCSGAGLNPCIAIGNLDGVHRGHQALLASARARSTPKRPCAVLTFSPHPQEVLSPHTAGRRLTPDAEKHRLLLELGVEWVLALPFDRDFAALSPEDFFEQVVVRGMHASSVHVGGDFRFGRARAGDLERLASLGKAHGVEVHSIAPVVAGGERISSSRIRDALGQGQVAQAHAWLGRPYRVQAVVVSGAGRGSGLGVATANLVYPAQQQVPRFGVYACRVWHEGTAHSAVANIGTRPTFSRDQTHPPVLLEAHLLDFRGDLYGSSLQVDLLEWVREEKAFGSVDELRSQIAADIAAVRSMKKIFEAPARVVPQ